MTEIIKLFLGFIDNKNARSAVAALIISSIIVAGLLAISGLIYSNGWYLTVQPIYKNVILVLYPIFFVGIWFLLYMADVSDRRDVYSEVREKLQGPWTVTYAANVGPITDRIVVEERVSACKVEINSDGKLQLVFRIRGNPVFADLDRQIVKDVAIRYNDEGGYNMLYYYKSCLKIQPGILMSMLPENGHNSSNEIEIETFTHVTFGKPSGKNTVSEMNGTWFDLNGNASRLFALLDLREAAQHRGEKLNPMCLSQVPIHQTHFDADMGAVNFSR